jgi:RNA polymerase sigma-70 factor, ECF subfamily
MHGTPPCLLHAWSNQAPELKRYLDHRLGDSDEAADLLQDAFIKALRQGRGFCAVRNPRAWLFQVARNTLTDRLRTQREHWPLPEDLPAPSDASQSALDRLAECLPRVLAELSEADRLALTFCDIFLPLPASSCMSGAIRPLHQTLSGHPSAMIHAKPFHAHKIAGIRPLRSVP